MCKDVVVDNVCSDLFSLLDSSSSSKPVDPQNIRQLDQDALGDVWPQGQMPGGGKAKKTSNQVKHFLELNKKQSFDLKMLSSWLHSM